VSEPRARFLSDVGDIMTVMFKQVLLCYDGSRAGRAALKQGAELAILVGAQVHVLSIISSEVPDPVVLAGAAGHACVIDREGDYRKLLDESIEWLRVRGVAATGYLTHGNTLEEIVAHSKRLAVDLIVVGFYPRCSGGRWWSGPERQSLAERVDCAVFIAVDS
jgi:nucleotide-binding universal stress UspA family protein